MQINLFAWIVKIVSFKLAPGGDIIMVVKNNISLVKEITDFFFFFSERGRREENLWVISGTGEGGIRLGGGVSRHKKCLLIDRGHVPGSQQVPKRLSCISVNPQATVFEPSDEFLHSASQLSL